MSKYRSRLPQLDSGPFLTDGGLETTLVFHHGLELPAFASFVLLKDRDGIEILRQYFERYTGIARDGGTGIVLETPTWRANADWGAKLGYDAARLAEANRASVDLLLDVRATFETPRTPVVISGNLGPRGDGYRPDARMTAAQARDYHAPQIETFARTDADMIAAFTMTYVEEAIGVVRAARILGMPAAISFTLETDGRLPSGETLQEAVTRTDAETGGYAAYYMINCAHPTHFEHVLKPGATWAARLRGLRANASRRSHAELDESTDLDIGDPQELGGQYHQLRSLLPQLNVLGGCCGTDHRHIEAISRSLAAA